MSTSNAMRQGLSMSFIFLAFVAGSRRKIYWMIIFSILATLTHNSGIVLSSVVIFSYIVKNVYSNPSEVFDTILKDYRIHGLRPQRTQRYVF